MWSVGVVMLEAGELKYPQCACTVLFTNTACLALPWTPKDVTSLRKRLDGPIPDIPPQYRY